MAENILQLLQTDHAMQFIKAAILFLFGLLAASLVSRTAYRLISQNFSLHHAVLFRRLIYWVILALFIASALRELGFSLSVLLGAAGVLSVALGFASQTSVSNLISGLFLIGEKPFQLGDTIKAGNTTGEVLSIDLLSVKLRTPDNLFVRIPNESLIKSEVTNLTRFPIRRFDLNLGVAYKENISKVRAILFELADKNPLSLDEPSPVFVFSGFGESSLDIQFSVWTKRENLRDMRNKLLEDIKLTFDREGIEIPYPCRSLFTGSGTAPLPVQVVTSQATAPDKNSPPPAQ
ncbi:mechanosensitive ion channel family protein [Chromatiaceae bacterium AAb-1]|nr:mechanosensitive ion channel family protein [Chromatiaceae bacterium AAb-1]